MVRNLAVDSPAIYPPTVYLAVYYLSGPLKGTLKKVTADKTLSKDTVSTHWSSIEGDLVNSYDSKVELRIYSIAPNDSIHARAYQSFMLGMDHITLSILP